jgi:hypothetical protein
MKIYFEVKGGLGRRIRVTESHWNFIVYEKHLEIKGMEAEVQETLINPEAVRESQEDDEVFLYYRKFGKYFTCVVCRHLNGEGFIITCYLTSKVKEGRQIWPR